MLAAIPGNPIAYWISQKYLQIYQNNVYLKEMAQPKKGLSTGDNERFFRFWFEVEIDNIQMKATDSIQAMFYGRKWFPINKGGEFRKWYGNNEFVVNYQNNGFELQHFSKAIIRNPNYYFGESLTWTDLTSGSISFRYNSCGFIHDVAGPCIFELGNKAAYLLAILNSKVINELLTITAPTLHYNIGEIADLPIVLANDSTEEICLLAKTNIDLSQQDWDAFETSWNFKKHPLI